MNGQVDVPDLPAAQKLDKGPRIRAAPLFLLHHWRVLRRSLLASNDYDSALILILRDWRMLPILADSRTLPPAIGRQLLEMSGELVRGTDESWSAVR